jgi:hypothetical protein
MVVINSVEVFRAALEPATIFDQNILFRVQPEAIGIFSTSKTREAWVEISLSDELFELSDNQIKELENGKRKIGLNVLKVEEFANYVKDESEITINTDSDYIQFRSDTVVLNIPFVDQKHVPEVYNRGKHERPVEIVLSGASTALEGALSLAGDLGNRFQIGVDGDRKLFYGEAIGDTDSVEFEYDERDIIQLQTAGVDTDLIFAWDRLFEIYEVIPDNATVHIALDKDAPAVIEYSFADNQGHVKFTLRPVYYSGHLE